MSSETDAELVAELFKSAIELAPEERGSFLDERCQSKPTARREVESLLQTQSRAEKFMERPALDLAAESFAREGAFRAGQSIGHYDIVSLIGKGGMGEVYLALDQQLHRRVALKLVRRGMDTEAIVRRFHQEQQLLAGLNHPNIAQLYDSGVTPDGIPFFAMEYVDGTRVDDYCREKQMPIEARLELFGKVCGAVHYAHQHLVVHRDIKPSNILVTADGEPKLLDFGIAKLLDTVTNAAADQTVTLQNVMTPEYASPEHVRGEAITTASDVYSLGVLLYELLTDQKPYRIDNRTPVEIARVITEKEPTKPSAAVRDLEARALRGDLDNIVLMAMRKESERRYSSAAQFSGDIRRHLDGLPVRARKDTFAYRSSKFVRRNRVGVAAAVVVVIAVIAGLIVALWEAEQARAQRDVAQRERSKAERINKFLQTMLSFSNQSTFSVSPVAHRKDVTVNEMLDLIAPRVDTELADQPDVHAQVLRTIGSAYASQGQYDQAEKKLRAALDAQTRLYGEESAAAAATMVELGVLSYRQLKFEEASRLLEKAVGFYRKQQEANSPAYSPAEFVLALDSLGDVKCHQGDGKTGLALMNQALQVSSAANLHGHEREIYLYAKADLGAALVFLGDAEKGRGLLREAIVEYQQLSTEPRWELGVFMMVLGTAELDHDQLDPAEKYLALGEQIIRQSLGDGNGYLANDLEQQAVVFLRKSNYQAAEKKAREALVTMQSAYRDNKFAWAKPMWTLADVLAKAERAQEAENYYRQALTIHEEQPTKNYPSIVSLKIRLSQALLAQDRLEESKSVAIEAEEQARQYLGADSPLAKAAAENLAKLR